MGHFLSALNTESHTEKHFETNNGGNQQFGHFHISWMFGGGRKTGSQMSHVQNSEVKVMWH